MREEELLEVGSIGGLHVLKSAEFPRVERSSAPGSRVPWSPGLRFVGVSRSGNPQSNGEESHVSPLWHAEPPSNWLEVRSPSDWLLVFSTPIPRFVVSGSPTVTGKFMSPSAFFFNPDDVVFGEKLDKSSPSPAHVTHNIDAVVRLTMSASVNLRWLGSNQANFVPNSSTRREHWEKLGYRFFEDEKTPPVLTTGSPECLAGVLVHSHDVPRIRAAFPGAKLEGGCSAGTKWSNMKLTNPQPAANFLPWAQQLPPSTVIRQAHYAPNMAWFLPEELPVVKECTSVLVKEPFPHYGSPSSGSGDVRIGLNLAETRLEVPLAREYKTASGDLVRENQSGLVSRKEALKMHKSYDLEKISSFRLVEVEKSGRLKQGWELFYRSSDLSSVPSRKSSSKGSRKVLAERYGSDAVPQCFWKYDESDIAARAKLLAAAAAGKLFLPQPHGHATSRAEGFVPPHCVQQLTGIKPIKDPCDPHRFFYQKISMQEFFANEKWVSRLLGQMGRDYGWVLEAVVKGRFDLRRSLLQSAFDQL